jgi:hypothetical protein
VAAIRLPQPADYYLRRWMLFVDGENFTIRGQEVAKLEALQLVVGTYYRPDVYIWFPGIPATANLMGDACLKLQPAAVRSYYYTSISGDEKLLFQVRDELFGLGFHPEVFKKERGSRRAKGVDISLSKDLLSHAYLNNYDVAVLLAGDGDYVPLVNEIKRLGKVCYVMFFRRGGLSPELRLASDAFVEAEQFFLDQWQSQPKSV